MSTDVLQQTVRLRVPKDLPCYRDWDFKVFPGVFALFVDVLCAELTRRIDEDRRHYIVMWLFGAGWYRDYKTHVRLRNLLREKRNETDPVLEEYQSTIWHIAAEMIYSRDFLYYVCPECDRRYAPSEGVVHEWTYGEDLAAHRGRRCECPKGHTLYSIMDWIS
jgi:hypothetical protein